VALEGEMRGSGAFEIGIPKFTPFLTRREEGGIAEGPALVKFQDVGINDFVTSSQKKGDLEEKKKRGRKKE